MADNAPRSAQRSGDEPTRAATHASPLAPQTLASLPDAVILIIMRLAGPRHARSRAGSVCKSLRVLSSNDALWDAFWSDRCKPGHGEGEMWRKAQRPQVGVLNAYAIFHACKPPKPTQEVIVYPGERKERRPICCTEEWRGRLTPVDEMDLCGKPAALWCDYPDCGEARCQKSCPENRTGDSVKFYRCSWCSVSSCEEHVQSKGWRACDDCQRCSCTACVGEVGLSVTAKCTFQDWTWQRCRKNVCADCAFVVKKTGPYTIEAAPSTEAQIAASAARVDISEEGSDEDIFCGTCKDKTEENFAERRRQIAKLEEERLEQLARMTPCPRVTRRQGNKGKTKLFAWAFGSFDTIDTEGRRGTMCFGLNREGNVSGFIKFPKLTSRGEPMDAGENDGYGDHDFVGLGPAWDEHSPSTDSYQPRLLDGLGDCVEVLGKIAPGPRYSYRGYCNLGYSEKLVIEKVEHDGRILLKCKFQVEERSTRSLVFFTAVPIGLGTTPISLHDDAAVDEARNAFKDEHMKKKRRRRERMERLIAKYPNARLRYDPGESSGSEIDTLSDRDIIPPWVRS